MGKMRTDMSCARVKTYSSAKIGASERHNERKNSDYGNVNVEPERIGMNVHYKSPGERSYMEIFREMEEAGEISRRGLKPDAVLFDEVIFDVNTMYFEEQGGYEFAKAFYAEAYRFACEKYGEKTIQIFITKSEEMSISSDAENLDYYEEFLLHGKYPAIITEKNGYCNITWIDYDNACHIFISSNALVREELMIIAESIQIY